MLDLHITHVINNGVRYFSKSRDNFDHLFPNTAESFKARMFAWLQANKINYDVAYSGKTSKKLPLVTVELTEALYDAQGLGNAAFSTYDTEGLRETKYAHEFTSQECRVNLYSDELEVLRLMHQIVKASMLLFTPSLLNAGYQNVLYLGTSAVAPEIDLRGESEGLGVYSRQCIYAALHLMQIPARVEDLNNIGAVDPLLDVQLQQATYTADDLPSGVDGGVKVES